LSPEEETHLAGAESEWREAPSLSLASEFVGSALVLGVPQRARQAAEYLAQRRHSKGTIALANAALETRDSRQIQFMTVTDSVAARVPHEIASLKRRIERDPRNALAWLELARMYTTLGRIDRSGRAIEVALALAPANRFVVRSAVAYFSHIGDAYRAHDLVRRHPGVQKDPWLLAADLAATADAGRKQQNVRHARSLLESGSVAPLALSELASELGSMELAASSKRAKRLLARAMEDPTENAAAQVEWAVRAEPRVQTWNADLLQPGETAARHAEKLRDWPEAARQAEFWLNDQPFSVEAGSFASYAAAFSEDYVRAAQLTEVGLRANPESGVLINNLAYSLIELGELDRAAEQLARAPQHDGDDADAAVLSATRGLLEIRRGNLPAGARMYRLAIELARRAKSESLEAQAWLMLARELQAHDADDDGTVRKAVSAARNVHQPAVQELLERLLQRSARPLGT
jgi:tetratricopeptide (TPR) repeat protein